MKASDLRMGNKVFDCDADGVTCGVKTIGPQTLIYILEGDMYYQPIPLTDEWLWKFGFRGEQPYRFTIGYTDYSYCLESRSMGGFKDGGYFMGIRYDDWPQDPHTIQWFSYDVKYVHQLQNLYFALTGSELEIK